MSGRIQHDHAAVAEHILVVGERLDLAFALDPAGKRRCVDALRRCRGRDRLPVAFADQQQSLRKRGDLPGVVGMEMADADIFDLIGVKFELRKLIDQTDLGRHVRGGHGVASIPQHVVVAMLDQIAAKHELHFQVAIRKRVRKTLVDRGRRLRRPAIGHPRQRDLGRALRERGEGNKRVGANAGCNEGKQSLHRIHSRDDVSMIVRRAGIVPRQAGSVNETVRLKAAGVDKATLPWPLEDSRRGAPPLMRTTRCAGPR